MTSPGTFAVQTVIIRPRLRLATATMTADTETPLHEHPYHDQFVHVAEGVVILTMGNGDRRTVAQDNSIIVPAGLAHSFSAVGEVHLVSICLGDDGAETRHLTRQPIKAWFHNGLYYLQGSGIRFSFELPWNATNQYGLFEQEIKLNDIDYIHPSVKDSPVIILPSPRRSLRERLAGWQIKRDPKFWRPPTLALTDYHRPHEA